VANFLNSVSNSLLTGGRTATFLIPASYGRNEAGRYGAHMQIGESLRTIIVEPLEVPVKQPTREPEPDIVPDTEPEQTTAAL
jgi:hypothetical protein